MDAWARLIYDEREAWRFLLEEATREGEFGMELQDIEMNTDAAHKAMDVCTWHVLPMDVPFCNDPVCPCHCLEMMIAFIEHPLLEGLLTGNEALRLWRGRQI